MRKDTVFKLENRIVEIIGIIIIIVYLVFIWKVDQDGSIILDKDIRYSNGWRYSKEGVETVLDLPVTVQVEPGETYTIAHYISENNEESKAIAFRSQLQKVIVLVDGEEVYRYPKKEFIGGAIPSIWNFVKLPDNSGGKEIQIQFISPYRCFSSIK